MSQVQAPLAAQPPVPRMLQWLKLLPGTGLSGVIALAATFVSTLHGGPQLLFALFFGVAFHFLSQDARAKPGIEFCARGVLRLGVGLLGARITATQIAGLGWTTALIVIAAVVTTLLCGTLLGRRLGLTRPQGVLSGGAVAICGASAALAISSVLPRDKDSDRFTLTVVVTVTVLSTAAMVLYPLVARALHLPPELAGMFIGGTIHDVAQVVGAGYTIDQATGTTPPSSSCSACPCWPWWWSWSRPCSSASARLRPSSTTARSRAWCPGSCGCSSRWWPSTRWAGCRRACSTS